MTERNTLLIIKKHGETVDAECLFINRNVFENTLPSLMERLNQLSKQSPKIRSLPESNWQGIYRVNCQGVI
jgi:hypothetical protein